MLFLFSSSYSTPKMGHRLSSDYYNYLIRILIPHSITSPPYFNQFYYASREVVDQSLRQHPARCRFIDFRISSETIHSNTTKNTV
jgi:hypothetical protein